MTTCLDIEESNTSVDMIKYFARHNHGPTTHLSIRSGLTRFPHLCCTIYKRTPLLVLCPLRFANCKIVTTAPAPHPLESCYLPPPPPLLLLPPPGFTLSTASNPYYLSTIARPGITHIHYLCRYLSMMPQVHIMRDCHGQKGW